MVTGGHIRRRRPRPSLIALALLLAVAACGNSGEKTAGPSGSSGSPAASTAVSSSVDLNQHVTLTGVPGVTDADITFSSVGTISNNPLGICVLECFDDGVQAYFDWRNGQGGIWGRNLEARTSGRRRAGQEPGEVARDHLGEQHVRDLQRCHCSSSGWADLAACGHPDLHARHQPSASNGASADLRERPGRLLRVHLAYFLCLRREAGRCEEGGLARLWRQPELQGLRRREREVGRDVQRRHRRCHGGLHQQQPRLRPAERHRPRGHGHEGCRSRPRPVLPRL